jgi:predicted transposase YbfD/YdcC
LQQAEALCASRHPESSDTSVTKGRNRQETRTADVFSTARAMVETEWSSLIKRFVRVTRDVLHRSAKTGLGSSTSEVAYYVANSAASARQTGNAIRGHWHIENTLHYTRDVTFREDQSRIRHNPGIFARLRSFAYNILQRNRTSTFSQERYAAALGGLGPAQVAPQLRALNSPVLIMNMAICHLPQPRLLSLAALMALRLI